MAKKSTRPASVQRILGEPRGRLLAELCGRPQTAVELAERVGTSSNAVRVHLDGLRSAGLVDYEVKRQQVGKPTHVYSLTTSAENLLSSAYIPTLQTLLDALRARLDGGFVTLLRDVGALLCTRRFAGSEAARGLDSALSVFESLGTPAVVETKGKQRVLSSRCCPLAAITRETPEVCQLMEQLLTSASGIAMREQCDRGEHPRCAFAAKSFGT